MRCHGRERETARLSPPRWQRKSVGLVAGEGADASQPLLDPLTYVQRALAPTSDLIPADAASTSEAVTVIFLKKPRPIAEVPSHVVMPRNSSTTPAREELMKMLVVETIKIVIKTKKINSNTETIITDQHHNIWPFLKLQEADN